MVCKINVLIAKQNDDTDIFITQVRENMENNLKLIYGEKKLTKIFLNGNKVPKIISINGLTIPTKNEVGNITLTIQVDTIEIETE